jgi:hypothetical protein
LADGQMVKTFKIIESIKRTGCAACKGDGTDHDCQKYGSDIAHTESIKHVRLTLPVILL